MRSSFPDTGVYIGGCDAISPSAKCGKGISLSDITQRGVCNVFNPIHACAIMKSKGQHILKEKVCQNSRIKKNTTILFLSYLFIEFNSIQMLFVQYMSYTKKRKENSKKENCLKTETLMYEYTID